MRMGGGGATAEEIPALRYLAGLTDARSKTGKTSDANTVMRYPIRESEFDHRRLTASPPPMRIHPNQATAPAEEKTRPMP